MRRQIRHALTLGLGWGLVGLGILGLFLPVLQGMLTLALGLLILSRESRGVRRLVDRLRARWPILDSSLTGIAHPLQRNREGASAASTEDQAPPDPGERRGAE